MNIGFAKIADKVIKKYFWLILIFLSRWANIAKPAANAAKLALHFGCQDQTGAELADCLRRVPAADLAASQTPLFYDHFLDSSGHEPMNSFSPRSDPESKDPFLPKHPLVTMEEGGMNPVPFMLGAIQGVPCYR